VRRKLGERKSEGQRGGDSESLLDKDACCVCILYSSFVIDEHPLFLPFHNIGSGNIILYHVFITCK
jgi:hypothetical protein